MKFKTSTLIGSVVIGSMLFVSLGGATLAASATGTGNSNKPEQIQGQHPGRGCRGDFGFRGGPGGEMMLKDTDALVEAGIISQETADSIAAYQQEKSEAREAEMAELKEMTEDERKAYFESKKEEESTGPVDKMSCLDDMVEEGILTQEEADAIEAYLEEHVREQRQENIEDTLSGLVDDETITQAQMESIVEYLDEACENRGANKTIDADSENSSSGRKGRGGMKTMFDSLVEDEILTQAQADAVADALFAPPEKPAESSNTDA